MNKMHEHHTLTQLADIGITFPSSAPFRPRYRMEETTKDDCNGWRRNTLRYCFNHEDELQHTLEGKRLAGKITGIEYAVELAYSNARKNKYRQLIVKYLQPEERQELSTEL